MSHCVRQTMVKPDTGCFSNLFPQRRVSVGSCRISIAQRPMHYAFRPGHTCVKGMPLNKRRLSNGCILLPRETYSEFFLTLAPETNERLCEEFPKHLDYLLIFCFLNILNLFVQRETSESHRGVYEQYPACFRSPTEQVFYVFTISV